jgi:hypothetical protein
LHTVATRWSSTLKKRFRCRGQERSSVDSVVVSCGNTDAEGSFDLVAVMP